MEYRHEYLTLEELQAELLRKTKGQIVIKTEYRGKSIVIPTVITGVIGGSLGLMEKSLPRSKILLPAENIAIAATTLVHTTPFRTEGYKHLFVTKTNPVWVTNPTGLTLSDIAFTLDNITFYTIHEQTGSSVIYTLETTDGTTEAFFIDVAATYVLAPLPSNDPGMKLRLSFTPAGSAESKNMEITVYGVS